MRAVDHEAGFSLIELLIVLTIAGIFASFAIPSFERVLQRARRTDALVAASLVQSAQERLHDRIARYGDFTDLALPVSTPGSQYSLQMRSFDAAGYELLATAVGSQARDADCRFMSLRVSGMNLIHASGADSGVANADAVNRRCWSL